MTSELTSDAGQLVLKVQRAEALTARIRQLELVAADGGDLPPFTAGAHIDLQFSESEGRSYSLLNHPGDRGRYVIAVLREAESRGGSAWIHGTVREGDVVTASAPANAFPLNEEGEHTTLVAGGIGITPILSMVERLVELGKEFVLHYCTRTREEAPFAAELERRLGERIVLHHDGGEPGRGFDAATSLAKRPLGGHVYVCGPRGLIQAVREATQHWPKGTVHFELFSGSAEDTAPRNNDQPFEIELAKSGKTLTVPVGVKALDVIRGAGIKVKTMCRDGVCGTCRVRVLSGGVDHRDEVLTDKERLSFMQVCVSRAKPGERLVLDL